MLYMKSTSGADGSYTLTGVPAGMWNNLEANYREQLARLDERKRLRRDLQ